MCSSEPTSSVGQPPRNPLSHQLRCCLSHCSFAKMQRKKVTYVVEYFSEIHSYSNTHKCTKNTLKLYQVTKNFAKFNNDFLYLTYRIFPFNFKITYKHSNYCPQTTYAENKDRRYLACCNHTELNYPYKLRLIRKNIFILFKKQRERDLGSTASLGHSWQPGTQHHMGTRDSTM